MRFFTWTTLAVLTCAGCGSSVGLTGSGGAGTTSSASTTGATTGIGGAGTGTGTGGSGGSSGSSGSTASAGGAGSSTTSGASSGAGGAPTGAGDCSADAQCPGSKCVAIFPGGFRVCADVLVEATTCSPQGIDACCTTKPCPGGQHCYSSPLDPYCGGVQMLPHNECAVDQCASDASCGAGSACLVAGVLGRKERACIPAPCKHDDECVAAAGGACAPVADPCCGQAATLYCVYPGDCRSNADCSNGYCVIDPAKGRAACVATPPLCPA